MVKNRTVQVPVGFGSEGRFRNEVISVVCGIGSHAHCSLCGGNTP